MPAVKGSGSPPPSAVHTLLTPGVGGLRFAGEVQGVAAAGCGGVRCLVVARGRAFCPGGACGDGGGGAAAVRSRPLDCAWAGAEASCRGEGVGRSRTKLVARWAQACVYACTGSDSRSWHARVRRERGWVERASADGFGRACRRVHAGLVAGRTVGRVWSRKGRSARGLARSVRWPLASAADRGLVTGVVAGWQAARLYRSRCAVDDSTRWKRAEARHTAVD